MTILQQYGGPRPDGSAVLGARSDRRLEVLPFRTAYVSRATALYPWTGALLCYEKHRTFFWVLGDGSVSTVLPMPRKHKGLNLISRSHINTPSAVVHSYNPRVAKAQTGSLGLAGHPAYPKVEPLRLSSGLYMHLPTYMYTHARGPLSSFRWKA